MQEKSAPRRAGLAATVAAALALGLSAVPRSAAEPAVGKAAPGFSGQTIDGKKISLAAYRGKTAVLLNFYANY